MAHSSRPPPRAGAHAPHVRPAPEERQWRSLPRPRRHRGFSTASAASCGPPLQPPYGGGVRRLDPPVRPVPREEAPRWPRRRRGGGIPETPRRRAARERVDPEPGLQRSPVPLPGGAGPRSRRARGGAAGQAAGELPVVLSREEVAAVLGHLRGTPRLMASLMYGRGLRLLECCHLRVKDVDLARFEILVRDGKGRKDRVTVLPAPARRAQAHLERVRRQHLSDLPRAPRPRRASRRPRPQVPEREPRVGLAVGLPGRSPLHRRRDRRAPPTPRPRERVQRAFALAVGRRVSPSPPPATPCATPSRPTCSRPATTSARSRSSSATADVSTTMIYTHVLNRGGRGVRSPLDGVD